MWDSLKPDFLARLPRAHTNGTANGANGTTAPTPHPASWEECFEKLEEYRSYTDDWDGQGAILGKPAAPISAAVVDSAVALLRSLRTLSVAAPSGTYPGVQGNVGFDWQFSDGSTVEIEVLDPGTADVFIYSPGNKVEHLILTEAVTA
jgi:hypothetical protein